MTSSRGCARIALSVLVLFLCACTSRPISRSPASRLPRGPVVLTLDALDGGTIDVHSYRGRVVVVHAFTTWSLGAQRDIPQLIDATERFGDRVVVIGLAMDSAMDSATNPATGPAAHPDAAVLVRPWVHANRIPYLVALAGPDILQGRSSLGPMTQVPTTVILAADGRVAHFLPRPLDERELARLLESMLSSR